MTAPPGDCPPTAPWYRCGARCYRPGGAGRGGAETQGGGGWGGDTSPVRQRGKLGIMMILILICKQLLHYFLATVRLELGEACIYTIYNSNYLLTCANIMLNYRVMELYY